METVLVVPITSWGYDLEEVVSGVTIPKHAILQAHSQDDMSEFCTLFFPSFASSYSNVALQGFSRT